MFIILICCFQKRQVILLARPQKCRCICSVPKTLEFRPQTEKDYGSITLGFDEYETLRLLDLEQKTQAQCAARMQVSRATVARIYESARKKLAEARVCGTRILLGGGDVIVCEAIRPECAHEKHCCHKQNDMEERR